MVLLIRFACALALAFGISFVLDYFCSFVVSVSVIREAKCISSIC